EADAEVSAKVAAIVDGQPMTGLAVARASWWSVHPDQTLVVGSSNPIRDLDLVAAPAPEAGVLPRVVANRGLAGIDGTISTATGVALATGRGTTALVGDLTFLHDIGGLLLGPDERSPD